jgi:hypothetical protein
VQPDSLRVCWQILSKPVPSNTRITGSGERGLTVTMTPDLPGTYVIKLGCGPPFFPEFAEQYSDQVTITAVRRRIKFLFTAGGEQQIVGTVTYDPSAEHVGTNVRNLMPNRTFTLLEWHVEVGQIGDHPTSTYDNTIPNNTAEFCEGICLLSPLPALRLFFQSDSTRTLEVNFEDRDGSPPQDVTGWGPFRYATYRAKGALAPVVILEVGTIAEVTP